MGYKNKEDQRAYQREHYRKNRAAYKARSKAQKNKVLEWYAAKKSGPCHDCGNSFHHCQMDFDHLEGHEKVANISRMVYDEVSRKKIEEEMEKCHLVCANCHRLRTWQRNQEIRAGGQVASRDS